MAGGPSGHAWAILIADIDTVKVHASDADYKYRDTNSREEAMFLLIQQYKLQFHGAPGRGIGLTTFTPNSLWQSVRRRFASFYSGDFDDLWIKGSDLLPQEQRIKLQTADQQAQKKYDKSKYGAYETVWRHSKVKETLSRPEYSNVPESHARDLPRLDSFHQYKNSTATSPKTTVPMKRGLDNNSQSTIRIATETDTAESQSHVPRNPRKRLRMISDPGEESLLSAPSPSVQQSYMFLPEEELVLDETRGMMQKLAGNLKDVASRILTHFHLRLSMPVIVDPKISQAGLQKLYKTIWGDGWQIDVKENIHGLDASHQVQSLLAAYIHINIFQSEDSKWIEVAKSKISRFKDHILSILGGQSTTTSTQTSTDFLQEQRIEADLSEIFDRRNNGPLQQYRWLWSQIPTPTILNRDDTRHKAVKTLVDDLCDTLSPLMHQFSVVLKGMQPFQKCDDWKASLQQDLSRLVDGALKIKQKTMRMNQQYRFRFIWIEYGKPVDRDFMGSRAASGPDVTVVVLTSLVPGLAYKKKKDKKQNWTLLHMAEILEKRVRNEKEEETGREKEGEKEGEMDGEAEEEVEGEVGEEINMRAGEETEEERDGETEDEEWISGYD